MNELFTCGQELAESSVVPSAIAALMGHVSKNLDAHAAWIGSDSPEAKREHDALLAVGNAYRSIAAAAIHAADLMRSLNTLAPVPHDMTTWDRESFVA